MMIQFYSNVPYFVLIPPTPISSLHPFSGAGCVLIYDLLYPYTMLTVALSSMLCLGAYSLEFYQHTVQCSGETIFSGHTRLLRSSPPFLAELTHISSGYICVLLSWVLLLVITLLFTASCLLFAGLCFLPHSLKTQTVFLVSSQHCSIFSCLLGYTNIDSF